MTIHTAVIHVISVGFASILIPVTLLSATDSMEPKGPQTNRVLIGLIDTGFDIHHPDLRKKDQTRIFRLWDQRDSSKHNSPDNVSSCYSDMDIDSAYHAKDILGHGTGVASIVFASEFAGHSPDADLVCVCVPENAGQDRVIEGVAFIRAVAESTKRPYMISLSTGFEGGAKDGITDDLEFSISELFRTDSLGLLKQVVLAAGNSNFDSNAVNDLRTARLPLRSLVAMENRRCHARGHGPGTFNMNLTTSPTPGDDSCVIELWYEAATPYTVYLEAPNKTVIYSGGHGGTWVPDLAKLQSRFGFAELVDRERVAGHLVAGSNWAMTKITLRDDTLGYGDLMGGLWRVGLLSGRGRWNAYITAVGPGDCVKAVVKEDISNECQLTVGANVPLAVCVGSLNPCDSCVWESAEGLQVSLDANLPGNMVSHFSSRGPTRNGVDKPDLYAPGQCCTVALSGNIDVSILAEIDENHLRTHDGQHYITEGTSYAAPYVTGLIASLIEIRPCLTNAEVKQILISSADDFYDGTKLCHRVNPEHAIKLAKKVNCPRDSQRKL